MDPVDALSGAACPPADDRAADDGAADDVAVDAVAAEDVAFLRRRADGFASVLAEDALIIGKPWDRDWTKV